MGTSIPAPAFGSCMTALLASKLGNKYGHSWDAQQYIDSIFERVTPDRWQYYFNTVLPTDEVVLYKLTDQNIFDRFVGVVNTYKLMDIDYSNVYVRKCMQNIKNNSLRSARKECEELYKKLNTP